MSSATQFQFPPRDGFVVTHFLSSPTKSSRATTTATCSVPRFAQRDPVILKLANSWVILNTGGGPTDDKPTVTLTTPPDPDTVSAS